MKIFLMNDSSQTVESTSPNFRAQVVSDSSSSHDLDSSSSTSGGFRGWAMGTIAPIPKEFFGFFSKMGQKMNRYYLK